MKHRFGTLILSIVLLGFVSSARAQDTIDVPIQTMLGNAFTRGAAMGDNIPGVSSIDYSDPAPLFRHVWGLQPGGYVEFPVTTSTPGMYTVSLNMRMPWESDRYTVLALETRPSPDSPYTTRFATVDSKDYGVMPDYTESGPLVSPTNEVLTVPLFAGRNILRIFNVTQRHNPAASYPTDLSSTTARPSGNMWCDLRVANITMNRVGELPVLGTITGTITGDKPAGIPVVEAIVAANPPGKSPTELSWFWRNGWFTHTRPDGTYTLQAPVGPQEIKAGRPSSYQVQGATTTATVGASPVTANITLPSIFFKNTANEWVAYPQVEYFDRKGSVFAMIPGDAPPENGYKIGYTGDNEWLALIVDVPEAGNYEVTSVYTNGGGTGTLRVFTDLGASILDTQPNSGGWLNLARKTYSNPIFLAQGPQLITQQLVSGNSDFDAIHLRRLNTPITVGIIQGKVTNAYGGMPVANASVTVGSVTVQTDAEGDYRIISFPGANVPISVTHPYQEAPGAGSALVTAGDRTVRNLSIPVRPAVPLDSLSGFVWKVAANTGGTVDYSAEVVDESAFMETHVPMDLMERVAPNDIYIWYRLHFQVPEGFLEALPGRMVRIRIPGVDDLDRTWLNGTFIGQTGAFPTVPLDVQTDDYRNPNGDPAMLTYYAGMDVAWNQERNYYFPASLLKAGDNVLAIKVFQLSGGAGLTSTPYLEIAHPTGKISGKVLVGGAGQADIRVAAMDAAAISSDWTMTAADGSFTLDNVTPGFTVIGAAKPGVKPITATTSVAPGGVVSNLTLNTFAEPDGVAAIYDDFNATSAADPKWWTNLWDAVSIEPSNPRLETDNPTIYQPGYQAFAFPVDPSVNTPLPGTVTIESGTGNRGGLLSRSRFSKYASVTAGRLVSALPAAPYGINTSGNVIFRIIGNAAADDPLTADMLSHIEIVIEGYANEMTSPGVLELRPHYDLWHSPGDRYSDGIVPGINSLTDLNPSNPLDLMIVRVGTLFDFYMNGARIHTRPIVGAVPLDHKAFLNAYGKDQVHTWDWLKASPAPVSIFAPGDITGDGVLNAADVVKALRIAGGIDVATSGEVERGNVVADPGITVQDALRLERAVNGQPL